MTEILPTFFEDQFKFGPYDEPIEHTNEAPGVPNFPNGWLVYSELPNGARHLLAVDVLSGGTASILAEAHGRWQEEQVAEDLQVDGTTNAVYILSPWDEALGRQRRYKPYSPTATYKISLDSLEPKKDRQ